mgnify:CR=1 FL=1
MSKPDDYSEETVDAIETLVNSSKEQTTVSKGSEPNIICVLLESFADPYEVNFLNMSEDPIPNFHNLESNTPPDILPFRLSAQVLQTQSLKF